MNHNLILDNRLKKLALQLLFLIGISANALGQSKIVTRTSRQAGIQSNTEVGTNVSIQYFDRFGRPIQNVAKQASPDAKDIIGFNSFDAFGRQTRSYLPYTSAGTNGAFRENSISEQATFYSPSGTKNYGTTSVPYADVEVEASPFQRMLEQGGVGQNYQLNTNNTTKYEYSFNTAADNIFVWEITDQGKLKLSDTPYFTANKLDVVTAKGPNWTAADGNVGTSKTFTDYLGRTILSRVYNNGGEVYDTYYVYDHLDNVRFIIPPEAIREVQQGNATTINDSQIFHTSQNFPSGFSESAAYYYMPGVTITINPSFEFTPGFSIEPYPIDQSFMEQWIFVNEYDTKNRLISKKVPGAEPVYYVYDKAGRLILSQDGNQRLNNKWTFTKYDRFDRPVLTGEMTDTNNQTRAQLAQHVESVININNNTWFEEEGTARHGYTNRVFPTDPVENEYLVVSYYDNYNFKSGWNSIYNFQNSSEYGSTSESYVPGMETGGKIKVLGSTAWLKSVKYYDDDGLLIQSVADHYMNETERFFAKYDWVGQLEKSRLEHKIDGTKTVSIEEEFEYDNQGRVLKQWHSVDDEPQVLLAEYDYNELGEVIETNLHSTNGTTFIQSIDNRYDAQGRLTHINNAARAQDAYNDDNTDQFGMELYYDSDPDGLNFSDQYNGNLAGVTWSNGSMTSGNTQRAYAYTYDRANRLTAANYQEKSGSNWGANLGHNDVSITGYDYNGNINGITRKQANTQIDNLSYVYNGNQLTSVNDQTTNTAGFKDGAESTTEYTYDANGNMVTDANKLITSIAYNQLNLPTVVTFSSGDKITYTYDAAGTRLKQEVTVSGSVSQTYEYSGGMLFDNGELAEIAHPMGRLKVETIGSYYSYDYQYFLTDHLGNVRSMIAPISRSYLATMETSSAVQEEALFENVDDTRYSGQAFSGSRSAHLTTSKRIGPAKALRVYSGDVVSMQVKGKFTSNTSSSVLPGTIASALASAFGVTTGGGENVQINSGINAGITSLNGNKTGGNRPRAYLNYLLYDNNYAYKSGDFVELTGSANQYHTLNETFTSNTDGYVFIYVSFEGTQSSNVYFDNLSVTHTSSNFTLQADDYYPFGLPMDNNNFTEAGIRPNRFLYQGKEWQTELGLNLYDFHARQFDPALGRFMSADAANQFMSPYLGMGNVPTIGVDPDGNEVFTVVVTAFKLATIIKGAIAASTATYAGVTALTASSLGGTGLSAGAGGSGLFSGNCPPKCDGYPDFANKRWSWAKGDLGSNINPTQQLPQRAAIKIKPLQPKALVHNFTPPGVQPNLASLSVGNLPAYSGTTIGPYNPGFFGKWAQSTNLLASFSYDIVNGASLTAQMLYRSPSSRLNLDGSRSSVDQRVMGFAATAGGVFGLGGQATEIGSSSILPKYGNKLDYVFGRATGRLHNVRRSQDMLRQLERIGVRDNASGRTYLRRHLGEIFNNPNSVLKSSGGFTTRESLLMGPRGGVKVHSIWHGEELISLILKGG